MMGQNHAPTHPRDDPMAPQIIWGVLPNADRVKPMYIPPDVV